MRYFVTVEGRTFEVDLGGDVLRVDGEAVDVELSGLAPSGERFLVAEGRARPLVVRKRGRHRWEVHIDGERYDLEVLDERTRAIQAMAGQGAAPRGPGAVRAPMPGMIVRVNVAPGDRVVAGQSVAIMEAMKMENDLKAEADAVVATVAVSPGQAVEKGALLVEFRVEQADG